MTTANLLGALEGPELLIILALVLVLFGGSKLPQLAKSLGEAKKEFHAGMTSHDDADAQPKADAGVASAAAQTDTVTISRAELEQLRNGR